MELEEIKKRVELLQTATASKNVLIADVAKELKCRITDLMQYILDNPKFFETEEVWTYKTHAWTENYRGYKVKHNDLVKDKCKGLGIKNVYFSPEENWQTEEWVEKQKETYAKTIWLTGWNNYGVIEGHYVELTKEDKCRSHLWKNTKEKINELNELGILGTKTFYIGGFCDCSEHKVNNTLIDKKKAEELGWIFK